MSTENEIKETLLAALAPHIEADQAETMRLALDAARLLIEPSVDVKGHSIIASRNGRVLQVSIESSSAAGRVTEKHLLVNIVDGVDWADVVRESDKD